MSETVDVAVVGGGLGGLVAATSLAREGFRVRLFEQGKGLGGRARTQRKDGYCFNLGPHALYRGGEAFRVLEGLGVPFSRRLVKPVQPLAMGPDASHPLPSGGLSMLGTSLLPAAAKLELARLLWRLPRLDTASLQGVTVAEWLAENVRQPKARQLLQALIRIATYSADTERQSAGAALTQFRMALKGVIYLDGGWQTLVDGLRGAAERAGVQLCSGAKVQGLETTPGGPYALRTANERVIASRVVLAGAPQDAVEVLGGRAPSVERFAREAVPVHAATLDLALSQQPRPSTFATGLDERFYLSVHSTAAQVAPEGGVMLHVAKYLREGDAPDAVEAELEALLDRVQPGWRAHVVDRRFLPHLTVTNALVEARKGGFSGRPGVRVPELPGVYLVGDWVGPQGMLADASLASARACADALRADAPPLRAAANA